MPRRGGPVQHCPPRCVFAFPLCCLLIDRVAAVRSVDFAAEEGVVAPGGGGGGTAPTAMALPPLDGTNSEVGASRVHFLYFLSSFLLLKTALSAQGQMGNVAAQDVFDEIVRNEVPLEEWPTYIFTRVYAAHGTNDPEIAALKAVAKHASRAVATGGEGSGVERG